MSPTFIDGDFTLTELNAIMQYLAEKAGDESLFPREPRARADVVRWQFWETAHFNRAFGTLAFETFAKPRLGIGPTDDDLVRRAQESLERFAPVLDGAHEEPPLRRSAMRSPWPTIRSRPSKAIGAPFPSTGPATPPSTPTSIASTRSKPWAETARSARRRQRSKKPRKRPATSGPPRSRWRPGSATSALPVKPFW